MAGRGAIAVWTRRAVAASAAGLTAWIIADAMRMIAFDRQQAVSELGLWGMRYLVGAFALTPIAELAAAPWLKQVRRTLGLSGFWISIAHILFYIWSAGLWPDHMLIPVTRLYQLCGTIAVLLLAALALTSMRIAIRTIHPRVRARIHFALYPAMPLLLLHEYLYEQDSFAECFVDAGLVATCFLLRIAPVQRAILRLVP